MAKKKGPKGPNKSEIVRQYLAGNPKAKAKEAIATLAAQGVHITTATFYNVKATLKKAGGGAKAKKKAGRPPGRKPNKAAKAETPAAQPEASPAGGIDLLRTLSALVARYGYINVAVVAHNDGLAEQMVAIACETSWGDIRGALPIIEAVQDGLETK